MRILHMQPTGTNVLGRRGENEYTKAVFDISTWPVGDYPGAGFTLLNLRHGDTEAYPVATVTVEGTTVVWMVTDTDLSAEGLGRCELIMLDGDVVAKSEIYITSVRPALDGSATPPEPWESWQTVFAGLKDEAASAAEDAEAASEAVQDMGVEAETLEPGSAATVTKAVDPNTGAVTLTFGLPAGETGATGAIGPTPDLTIGTVSTLPAGSDATATITGTPEEPLLNLGLPQGAKGDPGSDGVSPAVQVTEITGGHKVTVTDAAGSRSFDVMDGQKGNPGETGNGIASIVKTATSGLVDTYTITYTDGSTTTYTVTNGAEGDPGEGVPTGGTTGQMLVKATDANYDTEWVDPPEGEVTQAEFDALKQYVYDMSPVTTVTAPVVSVPDAAPLDAEGLVVDIEPVQDLHGYDHPWPAGGGKNLYPDQDKEVTHVGMTAVFSGGTVRLTGTATGSGGRTVMRSAYLTLKAGTYYFKRFNESSGANPNVYLQNGETIIYPNSATGSFTLTEDSDKINIGFNVAPNNTYNYTVTLMIATENATSYSPYSNICPISGWTGAKVTVNEDVIDITFPAEAGTVYGGTLDVTNGVLTVDMAQISSYAGETLPGTWISDRDVYAAGATPTTGAQVVYELATPITYQLTPQQIALLRGENSLSADCGDTTLAYRQDVAALLERIGAQVAALNAAVTNA